ncbi:MAG: hypothetical protein KGI37_06255 [Alphaproteobacteria bacterium]|nr:hypothetical protein [Alphaproteobacteria bacterium]
MLALAKSWLDQAILQDYNPVAFEKADAHAAEEYAILVQLRQLALRRPGAAIISALHDIEARPSDVWVRDIIAPWAPRLDDTDLLRAAAAAMLGHVLFYTLKKEMVDAQVISGLTLTLKNLAARKGQAAQVAEAVGHVCEKYTAFQGVDGNVEGVGPLLELAYDLQAGDLVRGVFVSRKPNVALIK